MGPLLESALDRILTALGSISAPVLGLITGAAVTTDVDGTIQQYVRGLVSLIGTTLKDAAASALAVSVYGGNHEVVLHANQLLSNGSSSGVLQGILASIVTKPTATDTFIITDGTTTETYLFAESHVNPFDVAVGADAAASQTNLIAEINARSVLWSAVATANLGRFFAANYATQFVVYRKAATITANDRIYGVQTAPAGIKVCAFSQLGYSTASATESNIPATDPGSKRFGLGRLYAGLSLAEEHRAAEDSMTYAWNNAVQAWRFNWHLNDLAIATWPYPGASVFLAVSAVNAETAADLPAGKYKIDSTCDVCWDITPSGGGGAAALVWLTTPGKWLPAGRPRLLQLRAPKRLQAITGGAAGSLIITPEATAPVL